MSKTKDIIKNKNVDMEMLKQCKFVENYNFTIAIRCGLELIDYANRLLTQEEFDLLKEEQEKQTTSKELEALETLKHLIYTSNTQEHSVVLHKIDIDKSFDIIEQALIELEQLREFDRFCSMGKSSQYCKNEVIK